VLGAALFRLRVIVSLSQGGLPPGLVDPVGNRTNVVAVYQLMGNLLIINRTAGEGSGGYCAVGEPGTGIVGTMMNLLSIRSASEPAGLSTALAAMWGTIRIRGGFTLEVLEWLPGGPFENCSTTCGQGVQTRTLACSSGVAINCAELSEDASQRPCADYSNCPPSRSIFSVDLLRGSVVTAMVLLPLVCCACWFCVRRRRRSATDAGHLPFGDEAAEKMRPAKPSPIDGDDGDVSPQISMASTSYRSGTPSSNGDRTFHISWDIDLVHVSTFSRRSPLARGASHLADEADVELAFDSSTGPFASFAPAERMPVQSPVLPAYASSAWVEYYSTTHQRWIPGSVTFTIAGVGAEVTCLYHMRLSNGQVRREVSLEQIRPPLDVGEDVQVLIEGSWVEGKVVSNRSEGAEVIYQVRTQDSSTRAISDGGSGNAVFSVAAHFVRRYFPGHSIVNVYQGPKAGWSVAMVHVQPGLAPQTQDPDDAILRDRDVASGDASEGWRGAQVTVKFASVGGSNSLGSPRPSQIQTFPFHLVRRAQEDTLRL
jgi:hypothetical protein